MQDYSQVDLRYTQLSDGADLKKWLLDPRINRWFPVSTEKEIEDGAHVWASFSRYNCSLTATLNGAPCGVGTLFLMPYKKVAHHCLFKIVVDPEHQRHGIGFSLLKNLKNLAKNYFRLEMIHIEIFEGNPIVHLLKKCDFYEFARQENFVKDQERYLTRILYQSDL